MLSETTEKLNKLSKSLNQEMDEVKIKSQGKINPICCEIPVIRIYGRIDVVTPSYQQIYILNKL